MLADHPLRIVGGGLRSDADPLEDADRRAEPVHGPSVAEGRLDDRVRRQHPIGDALIEGHRFAAAGDADELLPVEIATGEDEGHGVTVG